MDGIVKQINELASLQKLDINIGLLNPPILMSTLTLTIDQRMLLHEKKRERGKTLKFKLKMRSMF